jgi:alpha-galactosidase
MSVISINPKILTATKKPANITCKVTSSKCGEGEEFLVTLRNDGKTAARIDSVELFSKSFITKELRVFRQGFLMPGDPCGFFTLEAGKEAPAIHYRQALPCTATQITSHTMTVIELPKSEKLLLCGFTQGRKYEHLFLLDTAGKGVTVSAQTLLEGISLQPGESLELEPLLLLESKDYTYLVETYADLLAEKNHARVPKKTVTGWIDWQYYREEKNEKDILLNAIEMNELRKKGYPLEYVVVDGGWCPYASEWLEAGAKFPSGLKKLSRQLDKLGLKLGLWFAPYITNVATRVVKEHPEWLMLDDDGKRLHRPGSNVGECHMIDYTVPGAMEWMRNIVRVMVKDWGVKYLKLDGPATAHYVGGKLHDHDMTTVAMITETLKVIREECGEDVLIEGEGLYAPSVGYVDTQRTTQDNKPSWYNPDRGTPDLKENMKNDMLSAFMHGRLWHNHRENVILRDFLSPFHARVGRKDLMLTDNELKLQLTASMFGGGALLLTDPLAELARTPERLELAGTFLPHAEDLRVRPLDTFNPDGSQPALYHATVSRSWEEWHLLGVFNWDDSHRNFKIPLNKITGGGTWHAFEFWTEKYLGRFNKDFVLADVPAHACRLLAIRKDLRRPQIVGSNLHLCQGAVEFEKVAYENNCLRVSIKHFLQKGKSLWLHVPRNFALAKTDTNAKNMLVDDRAREIIKIEFDGSRRTEFEFRFKRG